MSSPLTSSRRPSVSPRPSVDEIRAIVLETMRTSNLTRDASCQLEIAPGAPVFGPGSPLDSLGLVALLLDIEDELQSRGYPVVVSDERAISQKRSPFRSVASLVEYIDRLLSA